MRKALRTTARSPAIASVCHAAPSPHLHQYIFHFKPSLDAVS